MISVVTEIVEIKGFDTNNPSYDNEKDIVFGLTAIIYALFYGCNMLPKDENGRPKYFYIHHEEALNIFDDYSHDSNRRHHNKSWRKYSKLHKTESMSDLISDETWELIEWGLKPEAERPTLDEWLDHAAFDNITVP